MRLRSYTATPFLHHVGVAVIVGHRGGILTVMGSMYPCFKVHLRTRNKSPEADKFTFI